MTGTVQSRDFVDCNSIRRGHSNKLRDTGCVGTVVAISLLNSLDDDNNNNLSSDDDDVSLLGHCHSNMRKRSTKSTRTINSLTKDAMIPVAICGSQLKATDFVKTSNDDCETTSKSSQSSRSQSCDSSDSSHDGNPEPTSLASISSGEVSDLLLKLQEVVVPSTTDVVTSNQTQPNRINDTVSTTEKDRAFLILRVTYLLVTLVIMLADGLQGTHLYVLYEGYGFSVASLYCLGFVTGGLLSPITGPMADKMGRKKAAMLYCALEMFINMLEQYPFLYGLILSRMLGGVTTNLLSSVFETWLDTEYRKRGFEKEKYEIIMRDSVIVSNLAAICSGYLAHTLAERYGPVGPFEGAVTCTAIALVVVAFVWSENYGSSDVDDTKDMIGYFKEAVVAFKGDFKMRRVGILQGLTAGCIQIFVFLWAPSLRQLAQRAPSGVWGVDKFGEPAYGLIFGAFMSAGVLGGLIAPRIRRFVTSILTPIVDEDAPLLTVEIESEGAVTIRPMAVEFLASSCYFLAAILLSVPYFVSDSNPHAFSYSLYALLAYELLIGIFLPCEGVIRSLYFPANARASIMTLPRIIVNAAVALGVVSTNFIEMRTSFFIVGCVMVVSGLLQISLISSREWSSLFSRVEKQSKRVSGRLSGLVRSGSASFAEYSKLLSEDSMSNRGNRSSRFSNVIVSTNSGLHNIQEKTKEE